MGVKSENLAVSASLYGQNKKISPARGCVPHPSCLSLPPSGPHTEMVQLLNLTVAVIVQEATGNGCENV